MTRRVRAVRRGQNTVEFAIIVSMLMLLTMGIVDFAHALWDFNTIAHLAREGARYAVAPARKISETDSTKPPGIADYVVTRAALPGLSTSNVTVADRGTCGDVNDPVVVTVNYTYTPATPLLAVLVGNSLSLTSSASMYVEQGLSTDCGCGGACT